MPSKPTTALLSVLLLTAAAHAQGDFDPEKVKALFARTEWHVHWAGWHSEVTFAADGTLDVKAAGYNDKNRTDTWTPSGSRSVKGDKTEWVMSADGKELHVTGVAGARPSFSVFHRGKKMPPEYPFLKVALAQPGVVWVEQGAGFRHTLAFSKDGEIVCGKDGEEKWRSNIVEYFGGGQFFFRSTATGNIMMFLTQNENGERILRNWAARTFKPEPIQPGDPLPPQKISRDKSPLNGTTWCRLDGKALLHTLVFGTTGTVSDSDFPKEQKPEWTPYDNNTVRYTIKGSSRRLILDTTQKRLTRETDKLREVWFPGRQPPKLGLVETKQIKDALTDPSKAWVSWDNTEKTVYAFDAKTGNATITVDDGAPQTVRWEPLCAGCIRVGDEVFMLESDTLQRVEPLLTLQAVAPGAAAPPQAVAAAFTPSPSDIAPPSNTLPAAEFDALYAAASPKFPADLAKLHAAYTNSAAKLDRDRVNVHARALGEYAVGVDRAAALYASRGDLAGAKAAREAKDDAYRGDAFTDAKQPELTALAGTWSKARADADAKHDAQLLDLIGKYTNALTGLIKTRLQKNDIDGAEPIQLEIDWADRIRHATQTRAGGNSR